jgi:hypothetical protein
MVDDAKDIKLAIHETILEFLREYQFDGWVSGKNVTRNEELGLEVAKTHARKRGAQSATCGR